MLKPFYNKKKNIDNRLVPVVSAADAGKVFGVDEEGNITLVEGGGGGNTEPYPKGTIQLKLVRNSDEDPETVDFSANTLMMYDNGTAILIPNAITVTSEYQDVDAYVLGPCLILGDGVAGSIKVQDVYYNAFVEEVIENCVITEIRILPFNNFNIKYSVSLDV